MTREAFQTGISQGQFLEYAEVFGNYYGTPKDKVDDLLARGKTVTILTDAVGYHDRNAADLALRQVEAKGAKLTDTKTMFGHTSLRLVGACHCDRCRRKLQKPSIGATG